jgi:methylmalonyl-CoA mutase C-terminal domain/subunit
MLVDQKPVRVLIGKVGLDGHDRGAKVIARALRDAGMEVIYTGLRQTPEEIVETALQEDVQVIGISILSGAHLQLLPPVVQLLRSREANDIMVIAGGVIPRDDLAALKEAGIAGVFTPGASTKEIIDFIHDQLAQNQQGASGI